MNIYTSLLRGASWAARRFLFALALLAAGPVFSQVPPDFQALKTGVDEFSEQLADSLPLNSTLGLNWSDAYIGQLLSVPPHFGAGLAAGITTIKSDKLNGLLKSFGVPPLPGGVFPNPGYTVEGRIGGFVLPFDVGVKVGYFPPVGSDNFQLRYLLVGGDLRYALLKDRLAIPAVSLGFGVNYLSGGIIASVKDINFGLDNITPGATLSLVDPSLEFSWETLSFEAKAQISKSFILFTPYGGAGLIYARTKAGYTAKATITPSGGATLDDIAAEYGLDSASDAGFSSIKEADGFGLRFFGGIAFNMAVIKLDISVMAATGNDFDFDALGYGVTVGVRLQL
jgi:hypothetical protein